MNKYGDVHLNSCHIDMGMDINTKSISNSEGKTETLHSPHEVVSRTTQFDDDDLDSIAILSSN